MQRRLRRAATLGLAAAAYAGPSTAEPCRTAEPGEPCYDKVRWSMRDGIFSHPEWYPGLDKSSSFEEFQLVASKEPSSGCTRPCLLSYHVSSQVAFRAIPKPTIRGVAYGPSPETTRGKDLPNDDFTSEQVAVMWAGWGRGDLRTIRALGANTVRLYGNDPRVNKRAFLDEAHRNKLGVIFGISDYPYLQAPDACKNNDFDCFDNIYDSYKENLLNGMTINGHTAYHPSAKAVVVINEPELKFKHSAGDCKLVLSAVDAMLQAEKDLGVTGNPVALTVAYSLAPKFGLSATGSMAHLFKCFMHPHYYTGYRSKNDLKQAYLKRWVNSFNTPTEYWQQRLLLERYQRTEPWNFIYKARIPIMIGEYHSPHIEDQAGDLKQMFSLSDDYWFPSFLGFTFFEFQKRYDKAENAAFEMMFGMFGLDKTCTLAEISFAGENYPIYKLYASANLDKVVAGTFGGRTPRHHCRELNDLRLQDAPPLAQLPPPAADSGASFDVEGWARTHPPAPERNLTDETMDLSTEVVGASPSAALDVAGKEEHAAPAVEASKCHTATRGEVCFGAVRWAMEKGIHSHPEQYPGLTAQSSFRDFQQAFFENAGRSDCSRPCAELSAASDAPECRAARPGESCYDAVKSAMRSGLKEHPELYKGLTHYSSFEEFQEVLAGRGEGGCQVPCLLTYAVTTAVKYRSEPKFIVKGIAYAPSPETTRGSDLPNDDFASDEAAALWASWGRGDLAAMRGLGANTVRLYGNDPRVSKRSFLDEALRQQLDVILGISDYPYVQAPDSCKSKDFDCFQTIYDYYKQNLLNGLTIKGNTAYHPAVKAIVVLNEPELKVRHASGDCKAIVSAFDAMLQAERDLGVTGNPVAFTVSYSLSQQNGPPATGPMEKLYKCFMNPVMLAKYAPKNDVKGAYLSRWVNSFNSPTANAMQRDILKRYALVEPWRPRKGVKIPLLLGEYHCPLVNQLADLPAMLSDASDPQYPYYMGFCFFEFQKRYDKSANAAFEMSFGMYALKMDCALTDIDLSGRRYVVHPLLASDNSEQAVATTFGGHPPQHDCRRLPGATKGVKVAADLHGSDSLEDEDDDVPGEREDTDAEEAGGQEAESEGDDQEEDVGEGNAETEVFGSSSAMEADEDYDDDGELGMSAAVEYGVHDWRGPLAQTVALDFDAYAAENGLHDLLTPEELERYKFRFMANAKRKAVSMDIEGDGGGDHVKKTEEWKHGLKQAIINEMPVVTEKLADKVNEANVGWKAGVEASWSKDLSVGDAHSLMGFVHDPDIENTTLEDFSEPFRRLQDFPYSFDSRQKWPRCQENIGHVRDQGKCGSCWAMATAAALDGRLCIASGGKFSGPNAWVSAGYIASCYNMPVINGCSGGNPGFALTRIKKTFLPLNGGVPTGAETGTSCVPYFGSGDALQHFDGKNQQAPPCPRGCTDGRYPRELGKDKFFGSSMPTSSTKMEDAKRAIMEGGPIPIAFTVFQDFMAYKTGYYDRTTTKQMGGHATNMLGWEKGQYLVSANSWGHKWGENGYFKMLASCCGVTYFISQVSGDQRALPLPGGPGQVVDGANMPQRRPSGFGALAKAMKKTVNNAVREQASRVKQAFRRPRNPFRSHDVTGEESGTEEAEEVRAFDLDTLGPEVTRVEVLLTFSNLSCTNMSAKTGTRVQQAASLAIIGKLSMLLPEAVVLDSEGIPRRVTVKECGSGHVAADWSCDGLPPDPTDPLATVAFLVAMPEGAVPKGPGALDDLPAIVEKVDVSAKSVELRLAEALGGAHSIRERCVRKLRPPPPTPAPAVAAAVWADAESAWRGPEMLVPLLLASGGVVAFAWVAFRKRRRRGGREVSSEWDYSDSDTEGLGEGSGTRQPLVATAAE